jgi:PncC family amidohydrolase
LYALAKRVLDELQTAGLTLTTAESCTGGLISSALTEHAGSSAVYLGGVIAYSNHVKTALLGLDDALIRDFGAVDARVARVMAEGAARAIGADIAVAVTGIAGPSGGTPQKPVGLVYVAVVSSTGCEVEELRLEGDRRRIREQSAERALEMVLECVARDARDRL